MPTEPVLDKILDRSLVPGWANFGLEVRRRLPG
jgi:hypothetical protein